MSTGIHVPQACNVCHVVLNYEEREGGIHYVHPGWVAVTHDPVPVDADSIDPTHLNLKCDLCNNGVQRKDIWTIPASDFEHPPVPGDTRRVSVGHWAACPTCAGLVASRNWTMLGHRVLSMFGLINSPVAIDHVLSLHATLAAHMTGEPYKEVA